MLRNKYLGKENWIFVMATLISICIRSSAASESTSYERIKTQLTALAQRYAVEKTQIPHEGGPTDHGNVLLSQQYAHKIELITGSSLNESELADLAIWAESTDPWFKSSNYVYFYVFDKSVFRLGSRKGVTAMKSLQRVKESLVKKGRFDGHLAEVISEAEDRQHSK